MKNCSIAIILSDDKQQVLLVKRRDVPMWVLPGGGIEDNETPSAAAIRETFEETGLQVKIVRAVAEYSPINRLASHTYTYECQAFQGTLMTSPETSDVGYFSIDDLPEPFFFIHHEWLKDALSLEPILIQRPLSQVTYKALLFYFFKHPVQVLRWLLSRFGIPLNGSSTKNS